MKFTAFLVLICSLVAAHATQPSTEAQLDDLSKYFRGQYAITRAENLAALPLVIVAEVPSVTWIAQGRTHVIKLPMTGYTESKILLHSVLGVYAIGSRMIRDGTTPAELKEAHTLLAALDKSLALTTRTSLSATDQALLRQVLTQLRSQVASWITADSLTQAQLEAGLRAVRKPTMLLVQHVGTAQYDNVLAAFESIRRQVSPAVWSQAVVIGANRVTARRNNLELAPAVKEFGHAAIGKRIFFADNIFDTPGALQVLAILQIDRNLSAAFFGDPCRMWRDFLGDVSAQKAGNFDVNLAH